MTNVRAHVGTANEVVNEQCEAAGPVDCWRAFRWHERRAQKALVEANQLGHRELRACVGVSGSPSRLVLEVGLVHPGSDNPLWGERFEWRLL
jgi:hypothetical protein